MAGVAGCADHRPLRRGIGLDGTQLILLTGPANHDVYQLATLAVGPTVFLWVGWAHTVDVNRARGETETYYGIDAYRLDDGATAWVPAPVRPDHGSTAINPLWTGQRILLPQNGGYCGPCTGPPAFEPTAVTINPKTGARTSLPTGPVSGGTTDFVWTGDALLGMNPSTTGGVPRMHPGETAALDPTARRWTRLGAAPSDTGFTGDGIPIWTGTRLITWGVDPENNPRHIATGSEFAPPTR